mmetsp:Transcript_44500/g.93360  ORF Transcript_44500/g.93360 Transcript_44500/m.93360 type:complete len:334 (-) Transcript_44500:14-1015(-)
MLEYLIGAAAVLTWLMHFPWHKGIHDLMLKLSDEDADYPREDDEDHITAAELRMRIKRLPDAVQEYMKAVCHDANHYNDDEIIPVARTLRMDQDGEFLLNGQYIAFTATQEFRTRFKHAGFVWDAVMETNCIPKLVTMPVNVCDAYINGGGIMKAQLPLGIPVMNAKSTSELNQGELMRWAAEATLFPIALIPKDNTIKSDSEETSLKWLPSEEGDGNSAILQLKHHDTKARLTFHFNPDTHLATSIQARRPRAVGEAYVMTKWEGRFYDYEIHGGVKIPRRMEVGWQLEGDDTPLEIYFKGTNHNFIYLTNHHSHHNHHTKHKSEVQHEHAE